MARIIRRYGSRKLYDPQESRYISLDEVAASIRAGEEVKVVDAHSGDDLTALTLTQLLHEEERRGASSLGADVLHGLVRGGGRRTPLLSRARSLRRVRTELAQLRAHLEQLARSLDELERASATPTTPPSVAAGGRRRRRTSAA